MDDMHDMDDSVELLHARLQEVLPQAAAAWLGESLAEVGAAKSPECALGPRLAAAERRVGRQPLGQRAPECETAGLPLNLASWSRGDAARVLLVAWAARGEGVDPGALYQAAFRMGDGQERVAIVRGLALLPKAASARPVALEAGRANCADLFGSLALENPFPAIYYTSPEFNQLVLKALFLDLDISAVRGLASRKGVELSRMCCDYIAEREAADRGVPTSIWLGIDAGRDVDGRERALSYLGSETVAHRYYAAAALRGVDDTSVEHALASRRHVEADARVRAMLPAEH